jgi:fatty-acid peroxygenase
VNAPPHAAEADDALPREAAPDSTLSLLADPYSFISKRCRRYGADAFEARLFFRKTLCLTGRAAAELFYDAGRFVRNGGAPEPVRATLFGKGGIQGLDGDEHRSRKQMFLSLTTGAPARALAFRVARECREAAGRWQALGRIVLYDELHTILTRSVCAWAGVSLAADEVPRRARQITAMFDSAGAKGFRHLRARVARGRCERWLARLVVRIREGKCSVPPESAAATIASYRDVEGRLLPPRIAAIELLNVLRPTLAISVYCVFAAHALHLHPLWRERLRPGDAERLGWFVQEVRRLYPFFPAVVARVRCPFEWRGHRFPEGQRAMLDLYGTNHDPRTWELPEEFRPERFRAWKGDLFGLVPQGGGHAESGHRCPGEEITLEVMKVFVAFLIREIEYEVPRQDLRIDTARLPALPRDRFILRKVHLRRRGADQAFEHRRHSRSRSK